VKTGSRRNACSWRALRELSGIDLEASYVLAWERRGERLRIDADLVLLPEHAFYEQPRPSEAACIRPAILEFPECESVTGVDAGAGADIDTVIATLGHGRIDDLCVYGDGVYELSGKFGTVVINAGRLVLRISGRQADR